MRIYMANVGANSNHKGLFSPLFEDRRFEFVPIWEGDMALDESPQAVHYRDLRSHYHPDQDLLAYVPKDRWGAACHNDPEFKTFTYGDVGSNGRSAALTRMRTGDTLLFLARLESWAKGRRTGQYGFYLIGGLIAEYAGWITPQSLMRNNFANNAHFLRGDYEFWGIAGNRQSRRFERAVPVNREISEQVFRKADGNPWTWNNGRSELTRISSYTRACRCVLDTSFPEQQRRAATLSEWIAKHSGVADSALLSTAC